MEKKKSKRSKTLLNHAKMSCCNISSASSTSPVCVKRSTTEDPASAASTVHPLPHNSAEPSSPSIAPVPSAVAVAVESDDEEARKASIDDQKAAISFASGSTLAFAFAVSLLPSTSSGGDSLSSSDMDKSTRPDSRSRPSENASLLLNSGLEGGSGEDGVRVSDHNRRCAVSTLVVVLVHVPIVVDVKPVSSSSSEATGVSTDASPSSLVLMSVPATAGSLISIRVPHCSCIATATRVSPSRSRDRSAHSRLGRTRAQP
ncbi:hypothetical protein F5888DRAFT_387171 [Russula emetica]|nr:hypothetical protein F5888DRAFT_387171 [Russula emetica]